MFKQIFSVVKITVLALTLSFGLSYALAWVPPTAPPPDGNVSAPLNVGEIAQEKEGPLTVGGLTTSNLRITTGAGVAKILVSDVDGNASWSTGSGGDNLGNHTATQLLDLAGNDILGGGATSTYGALTILGSKAGYGGINFKNDTGTTNYGTLMMNNGRSGFYNTSDTGWRWRVDDTGNSYQDGQVSARRLYDTNISAYHTATPVAPTDTNGEFSSWTRVVSNTFKNGRGNKMSGYTYVALSPTRPVLGIKISGTSDDGGACAAGVSGFFAGAVTNQGYIRDLDLGGGFSAYAWNSNAGAMATGTFIFDNINAGRNLGSNTRADNVAWNKAAGVNFIPLGKSLWYIQWYIDGGGNYYNTCYIDVLYGDYR